jgi:hypothetical protein
MRFASVTDTPAMVCPLRVAHVAVSASTEGPVATGVSSPPQPERTAQSAAATVALATAARPAPLGRGIAAASFQLELLDLPSVELSIAVSSATCELSGRAQTPGRPRLRLDSSESVSMTFGVRACDADGRQRTISSNLGRPVGRPTKM